MRSARGTIQKRRRVGDLVMDRRMVKKPQERMGMVWKPGPKMEDKKRRMGRKIYW
jgi:hypothetical protein